MIERISGRGIGSGADPGFFRWILCIVAKRLLELIDRNRPPARPVQFSGELFRVFASNRAQASGVGVNQSGLFTFLLEHPRDGDVRQEAVANLLSSNRYSGALFVLTIADHGFCEVGDIKEQGEHSP